MKKEEIRKVATTWRYKARSRLRSVEKMGDTKPDPD